MNLNIKDINPSYIFQTNTKEHKEDILNQAKADNKEACWVGYGTEDINSQYQPSPIKDDDYYMKYCNSDNYDYLKDYRLVWGYGIGIIETDVIINIDTGKHIVEGKEACDAYIPEEGINIKRGIWLRFSGNNFKNPTEIREVILPKEIISIKNLTTNLSSRNLTIYGFNSENIINWDYAFCEKTNYSEIIDRRIAITDHIYDLSSTKSMCGTFNVASLTSITENNKLYCKNVNENIIAHYCFYYCRISVDIKELCSNYIGGNYFINFGTGYPTYHLENCKFTNYENEFRALANYYFTNTIIRLQPGRNFSPFNNRGHSSFSYIYDFPIFENYDNTSYLNNYDGGTNAYLYSTSKDLTLDFSKVDINGSANYTLCDVLNTSYYSNEINIIFNSKNKYYANILTFSKLLNANFNIIINDIDDGLIINKSDYYLISAYNCDATINGDLRGFGIIYVKSINDNSNITILNTNIDVYTSNTSVQTNLLKVKVLNENIINCINFDNTFINPFIAYNGDISYPIFDDSYIPVCNITLSNENLKAVNLGNYSVLKLNINNDLDDEHNEEIPIIINNGLYISCNFTKINNYCIHGTYVKITNSNLVVHNVKYIFDTDNDIKVVAINELYINKCKKLVLSNVTSLYIYNWIHLNIDNINNIDIDEKSYILNYNNTIVLSSITYPSIILPSIVFYNNENDNVINNNLIFNYNFDDKEYIGLYGYFNHKLSLLNKYISYINYQYNSNIINRIVKGLIDDIPNIEYINDTDDDIVIIGSETDSHQIDDVLNDLSVLHWYGTVKSLYKENPTTACLIPSIIQNSISDDYFCLNEELTFINCRSEKNSNEFNIGTDKYYLTNLKSITIQCSNNVYNININNKIAHIDDNIETINLQGTSFNTIHLDYCVKLNDTTINNLLNICNTHTTLYINEIVYSKLTSEQIQQFIDNGTTLISVKNV